MLFVRFFIKIGKNIVIGASLPGICTPSTCRSASAAQRTCITEYDCHQTLAHSLKDGLAKP